MAKAKGWAPPKPLKRSPSGTDWKPAASVRFTPVPFKLLAVADRGAQEYVKGEEYGDYQGAPFDAWHKGDIVVLCEQSSYHDASMKRHITETWHVARRASTPSHVRSVYQLGEEGAGRHLYSHSPVELYRVPYRWLHAAAQLIGREFESRAALENAFDNPNALESTQ